MGGTERWDTDIQVWYLTAGRHELRLAPELTVVLVDGLPLVLSRPPVMRSGKLFLPESLWRQTLSKWKGEPAPSLTARPSLSKTRIKTIVVDAGHGGKDPGASGRSGLKEKTVVLGIARRLRDLLARDGFRVIMTRYDDRFISLSRRTEIANQEGADLFISIHANAARSRKVSGYEAYYLSEATDDHARAMAASENAVLPTGVDNGSVPDGMLPIVWDLLYTEHRAESTELATSIVQGMARRRLPTQNRGVKSARFYVLKGTRMPAVLIEVGFISHPQEERRLRDRDYRQRIAEGIRNGVLSFRNNVEMLHARAD